MINVNVSRCKTGLPYSNYDISLGSRFLQIFPDTLPPFKNAGAFSLTSSACTVSVPQLPDEAKTRRHLFTLDSIPEMKQDNKQHIFAATNRNDTILCKKLLAQTTASSKFQPHVCVLPNETLTRTRA